MVSRIKYLMLMAALAFGAPTLAAAKMLVDLEEPIFVRVFTHDTPAPACLTEDELIELELAIRSRDAARIGDRLMNSQCLLLSASSHGKAVKASANQYAWVEFDYAQPVDAINFRAIDGAAGPASYWVSWMNLQDMFSDVPVAKSLRAALGR